MRALPLILLLLTIAGSATAVPRHRTRTMFNQRWGGDFGLRRTEEGDTLGVAAVFGDSAGVYVYDLAAGRITEVGSNGRVLRSMQLQSIGRGSYFGSDFVVKDTQILFLNSVDRRVELFDSRTGTHTESLALPPEPFSSQPSRARRVVDRIFLSGGRVLIGNEHLVVALDNSLHRTMGAATTLTAPPGQLFALIQGGQTVTLAGEILKSTRSRRSFRLPRTHYPLTGKRVLLIDGVLYALVLSRQGITIIEVQ